MAKTYIILPLCTKNLYYLDLGIQGFEMEHVQVFAKDKSFRFHTGGKQWNHQYDYEDEFIDRFYYCYEGSDYVCYMNLDGSEYTRTVLNVAQLAEIEATKRQTTSGIGFLPAEIADFRETTLDEPEGIRTFAFNYSLREAQASYGYLGSFLNNVFSMYGQEYEGPELTLSGKLTTDVNLRPQSLSYDFSELEPYVLSVVVSEETIGALSYEITFDYDLADHVDMEP